MAVTIRWKDNSLIEEGHRIYKSSTYFTPDSLPAPLVDLGPDIEEYEDTASNAGENWYIVSAYILGYEAFSEPFIPGLLSFGIGPDVFVGGDLFAGYLGEVQSTDFITGDTLASNIGLTAGTAQNSDVPWWKFALDGEILYIPKKSLRHSISWDDINNVNAVYDDSSAPVVTIGSYDFRVTLMTGAEADPTVEENGIGSEWNRLIYRVHNDTPTDQIGNNWAFYNTANTNIGTGNGRYAWCQETTASTATVRVSRGYASLSDFDSGSYTNNNTYNGWRPVLRLIQ